jgi:hypothetical protein
MADLTIIVASTGEERAWNMLNDVREDAEELGAEFRLFADTSRGPAVLERLTRRVCPAIPTQAVWSTGSVESVLDEMVAACTTTYVLRLDDDERLSDRLFTWLFGHEYRVADHWAFPRANLFPDVYHRLAPNKDGGWWPDYQTRLSVKEKSGKRPKLGQSSPFGCGRITPCTIEHHKYLLPYGGMDYDDQRRRGLYPGPEQGQSTYRDGTWDPEVVPYP